MRLWGNNLGTAGADGLQALLGGLLFCRSIRGIALSDNQFNVTHRGWINSFVALFNEITDATNREEAKTLLLCWQREKTENKPMASMFPPNLGDLPKEIVVEVLIRGGYIHKTKPTGAREHIENKNSSLSVNM